MNQKYMRFLESINKKAPAGCKFKTGDKVKFTNENGVSFENLTVIGFADRANQLKNRFIYLNTSCYWFPKSEESLSLQDPVSAESVIN